MNEPARPRSSPAASLEAVLDVPAATVLDHVAAVAEDWGAEWRPDTGRLRLPVTAGLRRGLVDLEVTVEARGSTGNGTTRLTLQPVAETFHVNISALGILVISALGGLMVLVWPFFPAHPELVQLAPLGAILALAGWFLVVSRLTNQGPEEFLVRVAHAADDGPEER